MAALTSQQLCSFQRSLQLYLNDKNSNLDILKDQQFQKSRGVLLIKKKQLVVEEVKGNRPAARELTDAEEDLLFRSGEFGDKNPEALQRTVWWFPFCGQTKAFRYQIVLR